MSNPKNKLKKTIPVLKLITRHLFYVVLREYTPQLIDAFVSTISQLM